MTKLPWTRRISAKLWLFAVLMLLCSLAIGAANFLAFETFRRDSTTLVTLSRARRQCTEYLYLAHRLFDANTAREQTSGRLQTLMTSIDRRYDGLSQRHGLIEPALSDPELERSLRPDQERWQSVTRPALTRLLRTESKTAAQPLLAALAEATAREVEELRNLGTSREERLDRSVTRLQVLQGLFLLLQVLLFSGLLLLARSIAARTRVLVINSERLGENAHSTLLPVSGVDELAVANQAFSSTVIKLRDFFQAERDALGARMQTIASMNSALAVGAPASFLRGRGDGAGGVSGSMPPSNPPDSIPAPNHPSVPPLDVKPRRRILLVDDDQQVLRGFARILKADGYQVITASSAKEAIEHVVAGGLDAIVSDIEMPGMDGIQLLRRVRESNLLVPVVLVTGKPAVNSAAEAVELGAFQYLMKPVDKNGFRQVVEHAVRVHDVARTRQRAAEIMGQEAALGADRIAGRGAGRAQAGDRAA
jgi:CheY-like chemotaxis protein